MAAHDPSLAPAQMAGMGITVSSAVAAEDIRHLQAPRMRPLSPAASPRAADGRAGWACRR